MISYKALVWLLLIMFGSFCVLGWEFNGTVYDINGNTLNGTLINVTVWSLGVNGFQYVGCNYTNSTDASEHGAGWFTVNVTENENWFYKPVLRHFNSTDNSILYVGKSLPNFPYREFTNTTNLKFYLQPAGTLNITAINSSSEHIVFNYMVKDTTLGYDIESSWSSFVSQAIVYVPRNKNYSVMIYPNLSLPVSYDWNNFSSASSYNFALHDLSSYNVTTHTLKKRFNTTMGLAWVSGYINNSQDYESQITGWDEFSVLSFLIEPGNMIFTANGALPYNMSAWVTPTPGFDNFSLGTGFYNITLPAPAESATFMMFATAKNNSKWYGGFRNITLAYGSAALQLNFTMYGLMNNTAKGNNFTIPNAKNWANTVINTTKHEFTLTNVTGQALSSFNAHLEATVDYSNYGAREFTFMNDISAGDGYFYLPLLNVTGIKEISIFSQSYAPKRVNTRSVAELKSNSTIVMTAFSPGDIEGQDLSDRIYINLYKSNSSCDLPIPSSGCSVADSKNMDEFNPLGAVIGGGALSFRMGLTTSGIEIHYVNVDLLASGPPDALFDDSATTSTSGGFSSALRFGSNGPKIYEYVLVSMPYTEGNTAQTGLNEATDVNLSIPTLYDESWNVIWNTATNGTNVTHLAANQSHYSGRQNEWEQLLKSKNCTRNVTTFNATNPCYLDTANNKIWIRLPHFSGTGPNANGGVTGGSSSSSSGGGSSSSGGGGSVNSSKSGEYVQQIWDSLKPGETATVKVTDDSLGITEVSFNVNENIWGAWIKVALKDDFLSTVTPFGREIYKKIEITKGSALQAGKFTKPKISFKVETGWLDSKKLNKEDIALFRYADGKWDELAAAVVSIDNKYVHYTTTAPGFSYFIIGAKSSAKEEAAENKTTAVPTVAETPAEEVSSTASLEVPEKKAAIWPWIVGLVLLLLLGWIAVRFFQKK